MNLGFCHDSEPFFRDFLRVFQLRALKIIVPALTSVIFISSFSNMARTFIILRCQTSSIMEVLTHIAQIDMQKMDHLMR